MATSVGRVTEITASSDKSFEDAVKAGISRANKTLRGVTGAWIKEQKVDIRDGVVSAYRVNMLVTFIIDD
ncbi:MAG: dodecin family protein [Demequinaceae bacterium]|nr:dodecin family protein [Demequinaceae bacterium]